MYGRPGCAGGHGAGPKLGGMEVFDDGGQPAGVVIVRMRESDHVDFPDGPAPKIGRDHIFANVDARAFLRGVPNESTPPPSISISLESGKQTSRLSPCPTSMAVSSSSPGCRAGGNGCQKIRAKRTRTAVSAAQDQAGTPNRDSEQQQRGVQKSTPKPQRRRRAPASPVRDRVCQPATLSPACSSQPASDRGKSPHAEDRDEAERNHQGEQRNHQNVR